MNIIMEYGKTFKDLSQVAWDYVFYGEGVDTRSEYAIDAVTGVSKILIKTNYKPTECQICFDDDVIAVDDVDSYVEKIDIKTTSKVLLELTTLGVAEILVLIQTLRERNVSEIYALYIEPKHYCRQGIDFKKRRQFNLTTSYEGLIGIPGHSLVMENNDVAVILCGYESERVGRAFDETNLKGSNCQLIFGMPPYTVGWDMNAYTNHLALIENNEISHQFYYCGASNPLSVYERVQDVYKGVDDDQKMFILPFGTKPMAFGACLFKVLNSNDNIGILYDHPIRREGRSIEVACWNLYKVKL